MRSKEEIEAVLAECIEVDEDIPMELDVFAYNAGWTKALEWILNINNQEQKAKQERLKTIILTDKERSDIIGRAIQKTTSENQSCNDDEDSEPCGICTCGLNGS